MAARIFKPAQNVMQQGKGATREWVLEYVPAQPRVIEPLMGWTSSGDTRRQVRLNFATKDEAIAFVRTTSDGVYYGSQGVFRLDERAVSGLVSVLGDRDTPTRLAAVRALADRLVTEIEVARADHGEDGRAWRPSA